MKLPCYLVRDLLPLYKDQVCEPDTAADVREHLEGCTDCRTLWENMEDAVPEEKELESAKAQEQAAALRRVKSAQRKKRVLIVLAAVLATLCAVYMGLRLVFAYANDTYLDYDVDAILKVEYEEDPDEGDSYLGGTGVYIWLDPTEHNTLTWPHILDTEEGKVVVFTLGETLWNEWINTPWYGLEEGELYKEGLCTEATYGRSTVESIVAVYYLPYSRFTDWESRWVRSVPDDAILLWQRDDAAAPAAP